MRSRRSLIAVTLLCAACGDSGGGSADLPSTAAGDMCLLPAYPYSDALECAGTLLTLPVCFRYQPVSPETSDWMCMISPSGRLYLYADSARQVFYYPGWSFGPASRTRRQPAFKSSLSPADETRCEKALAVRARAPGLQHPYLCKEFPDQEKLFPRGTLSLTAKGMTFTTPFLGDEAWSNTFGWNVQSGSLTTDPGQAYQGAFYVRWKRSPPGSRGPGKHPCTEVGFMFPSVDRLPDNTVTYHLPGSPNCPRPATCEVSVTGVEGAEGYPVSGKFSVRNLTRVETDCADTADIDGTFTIAHPEL